ncbi:hypothetical protein BJX68DRAFT_241127 [Aspergillus pseudodeflectus]|uniref:Uncharacterized protein n=1 Tax=Aspergillus pseudodeflectus TaxID=176178 RepID=A0ABR4K2Q7_9EURO
MANTKHFCPGFVTFKTHILMDMIKEPLGRLADPKLLPWLLETARPRSRCKWILPVYRMCHESHILVFTGPAFTTRHLICSVYLACSLLAFLPPCQPQKAVFPSFAPGSGS